MITTQFTGDSDFFCTLTDARELSPFYYLIVKHDETKKEYILPVQIISSNERGEICRLTEEVKEPLESGKYIYKAYGTETELTDLEDFENLEEIETGIFVFKETRTEKEYYK